MQALILAGGSGTRLKPLTISTPKPVVPFGNEPFLVRQIRALKRAGIGDIVLSLNYRPCEIKRILEEYSFEDVVLTYCLETVPLGTAGAYKFAEKFLKSPTVVLNGDILTDIDLVKVFESHTKHNSLATIVLTKVKNPEVYGLVQISTSGEVLKFLEKPSPGDIERLNINTVNAGIYVFEPEVLDYIPADENYSFEYQLFPDLLERKKDFRAFVAEDDYWLDIGTPQRYLRAHLDLLDGKIKNSPSIENSKKNSDGSQILRRSLLGVNVVVKAGASVVDSVLGDNVVIEENAIVRNSVIWSGTTIDAHASISHSVVGKDCRIGKNVHLNEGSLLGDGSILSDFSRTLTEPPALSEPYFAEFI